MKKLIGSGIAMTAALSSLSWTEVPEVSSNVSDDVEVETISRSPAAPPVGDSTGNVIDDRRANEVSLARALKALNYRENNLDRLRRGPHYTKEEEAWITTKMRREILDAGAFGRIQGGHLETEIEGQTIKLDFVLDLTDCLEMKANDQRVCLLGFDFYLTMSGRTTSFTHEMTSNAPFIRKDGRTWLGQQVFSFYPKGPVVSVIFSAPGPFEEATARLFIDEKRWVDVPFRWKFMTPEEIVESDVRRNASRAEEEVDEVTLPKTDRIFLDEKALHTLPLGLLHGEVYRRLKIFDDRLVAEHGGVAMSETEGRTDVRKAVDASRDGGVHAWVATAKFETKGRRGTATFIVDVSHASDDLKWMKDNPGKGTSSQMLATFEVEGRHYVGRSGFYAEKLARSDGRHQSQFSFFWMPFDTEIFAARAEILLPSGDQSDGHLKIIGEDFSIDEAGFDWIPLDEDRLETFRHMFDNDYSAAVDETGEAAELFLAGFEEH